MQIYMVGGAVRDRLLGLPVTDRDWVVVGATAQQMEQQGFRRVGRDFPVFLHPQTHEEYALARTERKTAPGYRGFDIDSTPEVTLEQDLLRRDLTINAMAEDEHGNVIDLFGGRRDLEARVLRHVSAAFVEDPVRILRVARFAARFAPLGFVVAEETIALMRQMVKGGECDALVAERVWAEMERALTERNPGEFFNVLRASAALAVILPELDRLFGVPQPARHHPEIDTGRHVMMALEQAVLLSTRATVRFAAVMHDLGKGTTPRQDWPQHIAHEARGVKLVEQLCERLHVPNEFRELAVLVTRFHSHCHRALELRPETMLDTLMALDALRRPERFEEFLLACQADAHGRTGQERSDYRQAETFRQALQTIQRVDAGPLLARGLSGKALGDGLRQARLQALRRNASKD
ncbi:MAG: multifunctional CCA addition/repair protein [Gammaproteobacteria bacterium]|nr:multifunctional CCA addition/repair protein [Gammaproteobacteria bacterium]